MDSRIYILTHKQLTGQLSIAERDEFRQLSLNPEQKAVSEEIAYLWNVSNNYFPTKDWKKDDVKDAFLKKIRQPVKNTPIKPVAAVTHFNWQRVVGAAALFLLLVWAAMAYFNRKVTIKAVNKIEYAEILDNSSIWLDQGASLTVIKKSATERKVALQGEAFFDVMHDPSRVFTVDLGNHVFAEVLGTSFKARSTHGGMNGKISVREGSVRLYSDRNSDFDLTLVAGEEGELNPGKDVMKRSDISVIKPFMSQTSQLSFDDTPLDEVLDRLGLHYGVLFQYDRASLRKCRFSAGVPSDASLEQTLMSIKGVHEGLVITLKDRSTYYVVGTCG